MTLKDYTSAQLRRIISIKEQIEQLYAKIAACNGETEVGNGIVKRGMSAAGRARIAAAQRARWAKMRGEKLATTTGRKPMSAAWRAKIAAAARKRWRKAKAAGKNSL